MDNTGTIVFFAEEEEWYRPTPLLKFRVRLHRVAAPVKYRR